MGGEHFLLLPVSLLLLPLCALAVEAWGEGNLGVETLLPLLLEEEDDDEEEEEEDDDDDEDEAVVGGRTSTIGTDSTATTALELEQTSSFNGSDDIVTTSDFPRSIPFDSSIGWS